LGELAAALGGLAADQDAAQVEQLVDFGGKLAMADKIRRDTDALRARSDADGPLAGEPLTRGVYGLPVVLALEASPKLATLLGGAIAPDRLAEVLDAIATAGGLSEAEVQADQLWAQALASVEEIDHEVDLKAWAETGLR
jgi:geranylgeranyl pyrophosphate synthase